MLEKILKMKNLEDLVKKLKKGILVILLENEIFGIFGIKRVFWSFYIKRVFFVNLQIKSNYDIIIVFLEFLEKLMINDIINRFMTSSGRVGHFENCEVTFEDGYIMRCQSVIKS